MSILDLNVNNIFKDMKECVRETGLPVFLDPCLCDGNPNKFKSRLKNDDLDIHLDGSYDPFYRFAKVRFCFDDPIDLKDLNAARLMINSMNAHWPFHHYSLCPHCNSIEAQFGLYAPATGSFKRKFEIVFNCLLTEIKNIYPLMTKTIRSGGGYNALQEKVKNNNLYPTTGNNTPTEDTMDKRKMNKLLKNMEQMLKKLGFLSREDHIGNKGFAIDIQSPQNDDFKTRLGIGINDGGHIVLGMSPLEKIPAEKIASVMDVINRLNNIFVAEHLWLDCETNDIIVTKGIILPKMVLDRNEFEDAINGLVSRGMLMLKTPLESIVSDQEPEALINRMIEMRVDHSHDCKERSNSTLTRERKTNNENFNK